MRVIWGDIWGDLGVIGNTSICAIARSWLKTMTHERNYMYISASNTSAKQTTCFMFCDRGGLFMK